ncbi:hypothetical protein B0T17DRAFT_507491 [Bombardia bombarda]|uniref:Fungal N-terminal domain-containing protein n=1 Tax=Bombardia bombarda TaxID=252184 RepID=A0AA40CAG0_9PEZI|nr:hypothetical protein B0T17DRAFT_507491 [Bombardia bombarda]
MAEILGVVTATATALEQTLSLFVRIKEAVDSPKRLLAKLDTHQSELTRIQYLLDLVVKEEALQTHQVGHAVQNVQTQEATLKSLLDGLKARSENSKPEQFFCALVSASKGDSEMQVAMDRLTSARHALTTHMVLAHVSQTRSMDVSVRFNTETLEKICSMIEAQAQKNERLRFPEIRVAGRRATGTSVIEISELSQDDIEVGCESSQSCGSSNNVTPSGVPQADQRQTIWVIDGNRASDDGLMLNGEASSRDPWRNHNVLITNNEVKGYATMVNTVIGNGDLSSILEARSKQRQP